MVDGETWPAKRPAADFGDSWQLQCGVRKDGTVATADNPHIQTAVLIQIKRSIEEHTRVLRRVKDGIGQVRHFFHRLGEQKIKTIIREKYREVDLRAQRRRRWRAARKKKRANG